MAITITPDDYLGGSTNENASFEEISEYQLGQRAANYQQRQQNTYTPEEGDMELLALQSKLSRSTNGLEQLQLEQQINDLANKLVGPGVGSQQQKQAKTYDSKAEVINEFGQEAYEKTMDWAGNSLMSDSTIASVNEILQQDSEDAVVAFQGLQELSGLSEDVFTSSDQVEHFDESRANELTERFGQAGEQLVTLNAALASGKASSADVLKLALSNPQLRNAAVQAAKEGLINIAL